MTTVATKSASDPPSEASLRPLAPIGYGRLGIVYVAWGSTYLAVR